jgi:hypothetical protein
MRVKELIEELERQDPNSKVYIFEWIENPKREDCGQAPFIQDRIPIKDVKMTIHGAAIFI